MASQCFTFKGRWRAVPVGDGCEGCGGKLPASFVCLHEAVLGASSKRRPTWLPPCIVVGIRGFAPYIHAARALAGACLACAANCAGGDREYPERPLVGAAAAPDYKVWLSG